MKEPHIPTSRSDIDMDFETLKTSVLKQLERVHEIGEDRQRIEFFDVLRKLIMEKDLAGDQVAVSVLVWAYDRLVEES